MFRLLRWLLYTIAFILFVTIVGYAAAQYYKPMILQTLNRELKKSVNGDFQVGRLDFTIFEHFPNFSIALSDIYLRGPYYHRFHKDFMTAEKIYIHVNLLHLFNGTVDLKSIVIRNGGIFIFRARDGSSNMDVFKKNDDPQAKGTNTSLSLGLESVQFENISMTYVDTLKNKSFDIRFVNATMEITQSDSSRRLLLDGKLWFGGLTFNEKKGGYLSNTPVQANLDLEFLMAGQRLILHPSELQFVKSKVQLTGQFDLPSPGHYALTIASDEIDYAEGRTLITRALNEKLSPYRFSNPLMLTINLLGTFAPEEEPQIDISFSTKDNHFGSGKIDIQHLSLEGHFTNHVDATKALNDANSRLQVETVSGRLGGIPVEGKFVINNLTNPQLYLDTHSRLDLGELNHQTDTTRLKFLSGMATADIQYTGPLKEYLDSTRTSYEGKLTGNVTLTNGSADLRSQQKRFDQVDLQIHFTEKQMDLERIDFNVNGNLVKIKGKATGFIPFFLEPAKKGFVNLSVFSPRIDLSTLIRKKSKLLPASTLKRKKRISNFLEVLNDKMGFDVDLKVNEMVNGPFQASDVSGKVSLSKDQFEARPFRMKFADGTVSFALRMSDLQKSANPITLTAEVKDANIKKFFTSFNNFSQSTITSENLSGRIASHVQFNALVDDQFNILKPTMTGEVDFKIKQGKLTDFEPLQKVSNFLLKKRDFTDVQFAEINCLFKLSGHSLDIRRMEVESSVLALFLEGRYSLADSTDLSIQIPLSNLKRRDKTYKPQNVGIDAKVGPSVFLRAYRKEGKMVIVYDMFKKFKKKK